MKDLSLADLIALIDYIKADGKVPHPLYLLEGAEKELNKRLLNILHPANNPLIK